MNKDTITWRDYYGNEALLKNLKHQHLCNVYYFTKFFHGDTYADFHLIILEILEDRNLALLPWKPLPIPREIEQIRAMGCLTDTGKIEIEHHNRMTSNTRNTIGWEFISN